MAEAERPGETTLNQEVEADALAIGRKVAGRELTADEAEAMRTILRATAQALSHGFIRRLADHVLAERTRRGGRGILRGQGQVRLAAPVMTPSSFRQRLAPGLRREGNDGQTDQVNSRHAHGRGADRRGVAEAAEEHGELTLTEGTTAVRYRAML